MRRHKTITISIPEDLVDYLDKKIIQINRSSYEETNRSQYIRLLIKKDMVNFNTPMSSSLNNNNSEELNGTDLDYYNTLLNLGGYKR
ncbi:ribbon-helix-helix domain-containing protein [Desulforamulus aquiferis]|uniref:Ribbon-helix-helix domain-containing protein n=1 Tax=Desulforamulus aquiferis TaxID=1397668 RepID=A0AAW7Z951_9FIRM|nr:ribbon-helix-helix domain-containing protein [Desulforamulus aquiferis]MDO7785631.1 ribbon-helix-helix domain-containing protein [Desulforamulus aquiferis]RYD03217.1 hypothetical protein N752_20510 [Desulforamulus aquiferis]